MSKPESATVSEREAVLRERKAVERAAKQVMASLRESARCWDGGGCKLPANKARHVAASFVESQDFRRLADAVCPPPPMLERAREVRDAEGSVFRVGDGLIEVRSRVGDYWCRCQLDATPARVAIWADLFKNPTELIEDVGGAS